jgi:putative flippase GtrA
MIDTFETYAVEPSEGPTLTQPLDNEHNAGSHRLPERFRLLRQVLRFGLVGGLNTLVDVLILNSLLLLFPTTSAPKLLAYNSLAYSLGAVNSFFLNKYWTFGSRQQVTRAEQVRFILTTLCGIGWSSAILWLASTLLHPFLVNATLWANASKVLAISGTALISYLGMRLWVFVSNTPQKQVRSHAAVSARGNVRDAYRALPVVGRRDSTGEREQHGVVEQENELASNSSLSVVLPAYNEEQVIASTISGVLDVLSRWRLNFEVLVINDGSTDRTGAIAAAQALAHHQVRLITHPTNQGYGAALASGFAAATKNLTLFMDSDGQFDIRDLQRFFPFINGYDAVIGYRIDRQDSWMRKLNAWGWKCLIGWVLGIHVRDVDCAFKLLHTEFLHEHPLETRGAMINAELLYRLRRAGCSCQEIGVHHLPRRGGRATGARPGVILRALCELFVFARRWQREERKRALPATKREFPIRG